MENIAIDNNRLIIFIDSNIEQTIEIKKIDCLFYNIDKKGYYFIIQLKSGEIIHPSTPYRVQGDFEQFLKLIKEKDITLLPNLGFGGYKHNFLDWCRVNNKVLIVTKAEETYNIHFGRVNRFKYQKVQIDNFDLKESFSTQNIFHNTVQDKIDILTCGVVIIDKSVTLNQKYLVIVCDIIGLKATVFVDYINKYFLSDDENEIKTKIKKIFLSNQCSNNLLGPSKLVTFIESNNIFGRLLYKYLYFMYGKR